MLKIQYRKNISQISFPSTNVLMPERVFRIKLYYLHHAGLWKTEMQTSYFGSAIRCFSENKLYIGVLHICCVFRHATGREGTEVGNWNTSKGLRKAGLGKGRVKLCNLTLPTSHLGWAAPENGHSLNLSSSEEFSSELSVPALQKWKSSVMLS